MKRAILDLLDKHGLTRIRSELEPLIKESLELKTRQIEESQIPVGSTKIGGLPDLPPYVEWPEWRGRPLSFIAQVNLAELPKVEFLNVLPESGILYFFVVYSDNEETGGYDPNNKGSWRVVYTEDSNLTRRNFPTALPKRDRYFACAVESRISLTIPGSSSIYVESMKLSDREAWNYIDFSEEVRHLTPKSGPYHCTHRILGHPDAIQEEMQSTCQLIAHGIYPVTWTQRQDPKIQMIITSATEWELLLQIDSDTGAGMMWGDVGTLYYWMTRSDLQSRAFDAAWMFFQCC